MIINIKNNVTTKNLSVLDAAIIVTAVLWNYNIKENDITVSRACRIYNRYRASLDLNFPVKFWYNILIDIESNRIKWH